jgi:hypothetical protein
LIIPDLIAAFLVTLLLTGLLVGLLGWRHPKNRAAFPAALFLFLVMMPLIWAAAVWSSPYGPPLLGVYWLPFLIPGLLLVLLILAITSRGSSNGPEDATGKSVSIVFGGFFWALLIALVAAVILGYILAP